MQRGHVASPSAEGSRTARGGRALLAAAPLLVCAVAAALLCGVMLESRKETVWCGGAAVSRSGGGGVGWLARTATQPARAFGDVAGVASVAGAAGVADVGVIPRPPAGVGDIPPFGPFAGCGLPTLGERNGGWPVVGAHGDGWRAPRRFWSGLRPDVQPESAAPAAAVVFEYDVFESDRELLWALHLLGALQVWGHEVLRRAWSVEGVGHGTAVSCRLREAGRSRRGETFGYAYLSEAAQASGVDISDDVTCGVDI
eukprot:354579-Chlamydomonas_euryale.AAC.4